MDDIPTPDEARDWLKERMPELSITWDITAQPDQGAYERLLHILFRPRPGDQAA